MSKQTLGLVTVPKGTGWFLLCTGTHYVQNTDTEPVYFVFGASAPADTVGNEECHVFKHEQDDHYVNDVGDTMWIKQQPHKTSLLVLTQLVGV